MTETAARPPMGAVTARPGFRPDVQGLRGVAVLLVVLFHTGLVLPGGFVGVDVFFVISGFVIGAGLVREAEGTGSIDLARFYTRRSRRLLPALSLVLVVGLLLSLVVLSPLGGQQLAARTALAASAFASNLYLWLGLDSYFAPAAEDNPFLHVWSLSLEEQLYLLLPAVVLLGARLGRGRDRGRDRGGRSARRQLRRRVAVLVGVASAASLGLSAAMAWGANPLGVDAPRAFAFYAPPTRIWEFGVGVLLALAVPALVAASTDQPRQAGSWSVPATALAAVGLGSVLVAAMGFDEATPFPGVAALLPVGGTVLLIGTGVVAGRSLLGRGLAAGPLTWIGDRSYSWYLWHWPLIVFARLTWPAHADLAAAGAAAASLVPAALSYTYLEQPVRYRRDLVRGRAVVLAAVCLLVPAVLAAFVLNRAETDGAAGEATSASGEEVALPPAEGLDARSVALSAGCMGREGDPLEWPAEACTFGPAAAEAEGTLLLLGDSHAAGLGDVVTEAAAAQGLRTAVWTRASCALLDPGPYGPDPDCEGWQAAALDLVDQLAPDVVVLGAKTRGVVPEVWQERLSPVLDGLEERGIGVVVVESGPSFPTAPASGGGLLGGPDSLPTVTLGEVDEERGPVVEVFRELADDHERTVTVDPVPWVCREVCSQVGEGEWLFFDQNHLTPTASMLLLQPLVEAIAAVEA